jgi:Ca-activated chloride channel family protein
MSFLNAHWLGAALVLGLAGALAVPWAWHRKGRQLARYAAPPQVARVLVGAARRAGLKTGLTAASLSALALALAGPLYGTAEERATARGADVVLAVDVSPSMGATDVKPSRLDRAVRRAEALVDRLGGHRVALVVFSGDADPVVPLTLDRGAVRLGLSALEPGLVPHRGSSLEAAVDAARRAFGKRNDAGRALVVLSDGEITSGSLGQAVAAAKAADIHVYAVGVGEASGAPVPVFDDTGRLTGYKRDAGGNLVRTRLEADALERLAAATGGSFHLAGLTGDEVGQIATAIGHLGQGKGAEDRLARPENRYQWPLGLALALLAAELLLPGARRAHREKTA